MDEKRYHAIADATLMHCFDQLEDAFESGVIEELDLQGGILSIQLPNKRTYLLSKHAPSLQLWYASPISGGLHFSFFEGEQHWHLPDGRLLYDILRGELADEHIEVVL
jgi:CyaY protein